MKAAWKYDIPLYALLMGFCNIAFDERLGETVNKQGQCATL